MNRELTVGDFRADREGITAVTIFTLAHWIVLDYCAD